ncbi:hypothetical protein FHR48_001982 [Xanthomonas arboricola]|nr:hypothetical protein [Xanthomonas cannabis]NIK64434.1 hypothetical protein [Xanthomonas cannabis]
MTSDDRAARCIADTFAGIAMDAAIPHVRHAGWCDVSPDVACSPRVAAAGDARHQAQVHILARPRCMVPVRLTPGAALILSGLPIKNLCERCDAVCCRLTVMVDPSDRIPNHLTSVTPEGWHVMARDEEGWCVAIDAARMCCSIYDTRPAICRRFVMSGPYCRDVRATYDDQRRRGIPLTLYNA